MIGRALGVGVFLYDLYMSIMFTFHGQEQEYYLQSSRPWSPLAHSGKNKFSIDCGGCRVVLKTVYWILL